jgi:hypothetical protein
MLALLSTQTFSLFQASVVTPIGRNNHGCVYIREHNSMYVFGGQNGDDIRTAQGDLWVFSFEKAEWQQLFAMYTLHTRKVIAICSTDSTTRITTCFC